MHQQGDASRVRVPFVGELHEPSVGLGVAAATQRLRRFRDECLSQHWFASLSHMRSVIDNWRDDYNHHRPHSTLGYVPPATFAARCRQLAGGTSQTNSSTRMQNLGL